MFKYQKILVPIDFSPCSFEAYQAALFFVREFGSKLFILHVIDLKVLESLEEVSDIEPESLSKEIQKKARLRFHSFLEKHPGDIPIQRLVVMGLPFQEIIKFTRVEEIDLIVMGRYGGTGELEKIFFGSTAEKVVRMAPCAVLSIPIKSPEGQKNQSN